MILPEICDIAYSSLGLAHINTVKHYELAAACGFPMLKGDVRPTADGKLVMCHDAGFTFLPDGRIGPFDPKNNVPILRLRSDEIAKLLYAPRWSFDDPAGEPTANIAQFLDVCVRTGRAVFLTLRDEEIPAVAAETFRALDAAGLRERCMINSFTYGMLEEIRRHDAALPLSWVQPRFSVLTDEIVDGAAALGNCVVTMFSFPDREGKGWAAVEASRDVIARALARGIRLFQAQEDRAEDREALLALGFTGFQIRRPFPPYILPQAEENGKLKLER